MTTAFWYNRLRGRGTTARWPNCSGPTLPVILEHEHYGGAKERGSWDKELLLKAVEEYHGSYMSIHWWPRILLEENRDIIDRINRRMGYRLFMESAEWPESVRMGETFEIRSLWSNTGVAPCYKGGHPSFTLKDDQGGHRLDVSRRPV